jgi:twitching motility protein PilI
MNPAGPLPDEAPLAGTTQAAPPVAPSSAAAAAPRSWLAVEAAGLGLLFPLNQAGEIFPMVPILPVAHAVPWFTGVANLRGALHGVVDLALFLGLKPAAERPGARDHARLLALHAELRTQCALKVDQLAGLRRVDDMVQVLTEGTRPAFAGPLWEDKQGRQWQEIDLAALARSERFLAIALGPAAVTPVAASAALS